MSDKYNQEWVMLLAQPGATRWAITLFGTTYYSCPESEVDVKYRLHEERHKWQQKKEGFSFYWDYLRNQAKYGYKDNPYEQGARKAEIT